MVTVKVKVCGLTRVDEALASAEAGADWIGLNFHPGSPRRVDIDVAAEIIRALPADCEPVGLFVDRPPAEVAAVADRLGLKVVQLHGREPVDDLIALRHLRIVKAYRLGTLADVTAMVDELRRAYALIRAPDAFLVDAFVPGQSGGTGQAIALDLLDSLPPALPPLILAGGLTPENVAERVRRVRPWMVDVASGVESAPGRKDPGRVAAFIKAAREASIS